MKYLLTFLFLLLTSIVHSQEFSSSELAFQEPTKSIKIEYLNDAALNADRIKYAKYRPIRVPGEFRYLDINFPNVSLAQEVANTIKSNPNVLNITYITQTFDQVVPNDTLYSQQWHLPLMRVPQAWDLQIGDGTMFVTAPDNGVVAAGHEDVVYGAKGFNFFNLSPGVDPGIPRSNADLPHYTHGMQCAGLIAGITNNSKGISASSYSTKFLPLTIADALNKGASDTSTMDKAFLYAMNYGVKVVSISNGPVRADDLLVIKSAQKYKDQAVLIIAGGNENNNINGKEISDYAIFVGASTIDDKRAIFSNYGLGIDIFAPGANVLTTTQNPNTRLNQQNTYSNFSGTSAAAPCLAGVVALMKYANPNLSTKQIKIILKNTAKDIGTAGYDTQTTWGRVDAYDAIRAAKGLLQLTDTAPPQVYISRFSANDWWGYASWPGYARNVTTLLINSVDNFEIAKLEIYIDNIKIHEKTSGWDRSLTFYQFNSRNYSNGTHNVKAIAYDTSGYSKTDSFNFQILNTEPDIKAPIIKILNPIKNSILFDQFSVNVEAFDYEDQISKVELYIDNVLVKTLNDFPYITNLNTKDFTLGTKTLKAVAYDRSNNKAEASISIKFASSIDTQPPIVIITSPPTLTIVRENVFRIVLTAQDNSGIAKFNLYRNDVLVQSSLFPSFPANLQGFSTGDYTYYAEAIDTSENIGRSLPIVIRKR